MGEKRSTCAEYSGSDRVRGEFQDPLLQDGNLDLV